MASLALMVSLIFLSVILSGPVSIALEKLGMPMLASVLAVLSIVSGLYWLCVTPFPISLAGALSAGCGMVTLSRI